MTTTKIVSSKINSEYVRTAIPKTIAEFLEISQGDKINWKVKTTQDKRYVIISKVN